MVCKCLRWLGAPSSEITELKLTMSWMFRGRPPQPKNVILWGSSGTGKTLLLAEMLMMRIAHYRDGHRDGPTGRRGVDIIQKTHGVT